MKLDFQILNSKNLDVEINELVVAGWAGRDIKAIEHHIEELALLGVPRPSKVPLFYRIAENQLTQNNTIQVLGEDSSGETEVFIFRKNNEFYISLTSDHTDRKLESYSVAFSKQTCIKPTAKTAWLHSEVTNHWDKLVLRSYILEDNKKKLYQEGNLSSLQNPLDLIKSYCGSLENFKEGIGMTCGTVGAIGGIRPSKQFFMELFDPMLNRSINHNYEIISLPIVA